MEWDSKLGSSHLNNRRETMSENNLESLDQTASTSEVARLEDEITQLEEEIHNEKENKEDRLINADSIIELVSIVTLGIIAGSFEDSRPLACLLTIIGMIAWLVIIFRRMDQKDKK
jgi:F0F1-type ATP synthase assembly protein I